MGEFGPWHLLIIAAVFVLLFGAKKLPDAARSMGRSLRIFKTEIKGLHDDDETAQPVAPPQQLPAAQQPPVQPTPVAPAGDRPDQTA